MKLSYWNKMNRRDLTLWIELVVRMSVPYLYRLPSPERVNYKKNYV